MERPHIVERVREIRLLWRETARRETGILLDRLEQAWAVAVAKGSPFMMLQVIRLQADLSGLSRRGLHRRADLWPLPDEDEFGELATALEAAGDPDFFRTAQPGPLAAALQRRNGTGAPEPAVEEQGTKAGEPNRQGTNSRRLRRPTTIRRRRITTRRRSILREPAPTSRRATTTPSTPAKTAGYTHCAAATIRSIPARRKKWRCGRKTRPASRPIRPGSPSRPWRRQRAPERRPMTEHDIS